MHPFRYTSLDAGDRISPLIQFTGERSGRGGRVLLSNTLFGSVSSIVRRIPFRESIGKEVISLLVCLRHARNEICTSGVAIASPYLIVFVIDYPDIV